MRNNRISEGMTKDKTPLQKARKKYEEINLEERKASTKQFNTRIPTKNYDKINLFLKRHKISKVDLIFAGYEYLKNQYQKK